MLEIELFYKIVEEHIRADHTEYLKSLKRVPKLEENVNKRWIPFKKLPIDDKLLKGYNKGIEKALSILKAEFKRYTKRIEKEEKGGKRF